MSEMKTCFKKVDYDLSGLLHYIDIGSPDGRIEWKPSGGQTLKQLQEAQAAE